MRCCVIDVVGRCVMIRRHAVERPYVIVVTVSACAGRDPKSPARKDTPACYVRRSVRTRPRLGAEGGFDGTEEADVGQMTQSRWWSAVSEGDNEGNRMHVIKISIMGKGLWRIYIE
jgi:hypothetical protein